ncbi:MAG: tetratricopeptide repeat protein [Pseudomonadota bacterium]
MKTFLIAFVTSYLFSQSCLGETEGRQIDPHALNELELYFPYSPENGVNFTSGFDALNGDSVFSAGDFDADEDGLTFWFIKPGHRNALKVSVKEKKRTPLFEAVHKDYQTGKISQALFGANSQYIFFRKNIEGVKSARAINNSDGTIVFAFESFAGAKNNIAFDEKSKRALYFTSQFPNAPVYTYRFRKLNASENTALLAMLHHDQAEYYKELESPENAEKHLGESCDRGLELACTERSAMLKKKENDEIIARVSDPEINRGKCDTNESGDGGSCYIAAYLGDYDPPEKLRLYAKACQRGNFLGCTIVGEMYRDGDGVPTDTSKAFTYYKAACSGNQPVGCHNYGLFLERRNTQTDLIQARNAYEKICTENITNGCARLALMYSDGRGGEKKLSLVRSTARKSCEADDFEGCTVLGIFLMSDLYGPPKIDEAKTFLKKGCDGGNDHGCETLEKLQGIAP